MKKDDYFINPQNVRFNFNAYRQRTDKYGFTRDFKEYIAEKYDENHQLISAALTPKGYLKRISMNENWGIFQIETTRITFSSRNWSDLRST